MPENTPKDIELPKENAPMTKGRLRDIANVQLDRYFHPGGDITLPKDVPSEPVKGLKKAL